MVEMAVVPFELPAMVEMGHNGPTKEWRVEKVTHSL